MTHPLPQVVLTRSRAPVARHYAGVGGSINPRECEMSERREDHTPEQPLVKNERGRYYYDDATGYETYDPSKENEDEDPNGTAQEPSKAPPR